ncbi:hypothetical protein C0J52_11055 [Blattella germanica]|nr:hypothetical protein C0J52_11055 [Blattella germanica]
MLESGAPKIRTCIQNTYVIPKINVFCAISLEMVYGPYFFAEDTVNGISYLDMLEFWLMQQLQTYPQIIFQQDGAPPHLHNEVRRYLKMHCRDAELGMGVNDMTG